MGSAIVGSTKNATGEGEFDDSGILKDLYYLSLTYMYFILIIVQDNFQSIELQYLNICTRRNAVGPITMVRCQQLLI